MFLRVIKVINALTSKLDEHYRPFDPCIISSFKPVLPNKSAVPGKRNPPATCTKSLKMVKSV